MRIFKVFDFQFPVITDFTEARERMLQISRGCIRIEGVCTEDCEHYENCEIRIVTEMELIGSY